MDATPPVLAAGAVVWRPANGAVAVLLVHRPKYDDWSFPKGKVDPGEHLTATAVREVAEETGLEVRLGIPLPQQEYVSAPGVTKRVCYWAARPADTDTSVDDYVPNREVDAVVWLPLDQARERLTYARDVHVLQAFAVGAYRAEPLVVLRHAQALPRDSWTGPDRERGLAAAGEREACALVPLLRAYGVRRVLSSDASRCTATVQPYAEAGRLRVEIDHRLSEEGLHSAAAARRMQTLLDDDRPVVVCSHRPVLPALFEAIGMHDPGLRPGAFVVVHREGGQVRATEQHGP
ncbi:MAG: NUDIX domain-containing protein [Actinomycetota bacterium]|nr:NUDIX domain-containing protein [Actinomycetota bacterium]